MPNSPHSYSCTWRVVFGVAVFQSFNRKRGPGDLAGRLPPQLSKKKRVKRLRERKQKDFFIQRLRSPSVFSLPLNPSFFNHQTPNVGLTAHHLSRTRERGLSMHWNPVCEKRKINFKVTSILYPSQDGLRYMLVFRYKTRPPSRHWNIRTNSYMSGKARILGALLYRVPPNKSWFCFEFQLVIASMNTGKKARKKGPLPRLIKTKNVGGFMLLFKYFAKFQLAPPSAKKAT